MRVSTIFPALLSLLSISSAFPHKPPHYNHWTNTTTLLSPRQEHSTVALGDNIYIVGGVIANFSSTALFETYHIPSQTWKTLAPIPVALNHVNAAVVNGRIYVLGGLVPDAAGTSWVASTNTGFVYTPQTNSWRTLSQIPSEHARGSAAVGVRDGRVYLAGGVTLLELVNGGRQSSVDWTSIYDARSDSWSFLPSGAAKMPEGRDHAGSGLVGNTFFVLGGRYRGQANVRDTVFALDLKNLGKGWVTRNGRLPTARGGLSTATIGSKVYTFGGEGNPNNTETGVFPQTEVYDAVYDRWDTLEDMPLPVHGSYAVGAGDKVYIPGGGERIGGGAVDTFQVFKP